MEKKKKEKKRNKVSSFFHRLIYGTDATPLTGGNYADESETGEILTGFPAPESHDFLKTDIPPDDSSAFHGGSFSGAGSGGSWTDGDSGSDHSSSYDYDGGSGDSGSSYDSGSSDCGSSDSGGGCDGGGGGSD